MSAMALCACVLIFCFFVCFVFVACCCRSLHIAYCDPQTLAYGFYYGVGDEARQGRLLLLWDVPVSYSQPLLAHSTSPLKHSSEYSVR